ncbi:mediator of DNA damage checkpoint protein 1 isoform X2 [Nyctibius grandis]|uniref:mediator of DNA damage checkpoint protein 1 isoform X2 n=1 Tax=Nyctibius grandis TaxID=48427 RepID=UPI0035BC2761
MPRRRHRGLSTLGGTGRPPERGPPLASDSEDEELPQRPTITMRAPGDTASPRVVPESDPEEPDVRPDVRRPRKRRRKPAWGQRPDVGERAPHADVGGAKKRWRVLVVDSDTDVEDGDILPDVGAPKLLRMAPNGPESPDVEREAPNPDVGGPQNGRWPLVDSDTDVEMESSAAGGPREGQQMLVVDSDTDVEENGVNPDVGHPKTHRMTQNVPKTQTMAMETRNADVEGSPKGHRMFMVDSDTDVEENGVNPDVGHPKIHKTTQNIPKPPNIVMETHNADVEGSPKGHRRLVVDSDTDVEEDTSNPDVGCPESHQMPPRDPDVQTATMNRGVEGRWRLLVDSDTDVEEDAPNPDVGTHRASPDVQRNQHVGTGSPNPRVGGPQNKAWTLVVDSDTDVEEKEENPDVGWPIIHRITSKDPNPDVEEPQKERWSPDSETDVKEDDLGQGGLCPQSHKTPQTTQKHPTVVMETPNPDVGGLRCGSVATDGDSDTDVEDLNALPGAGAPKRGGTSHEVSDPVANMTAAPDVDLEGWTRTNAHPDVKAMSANPDVEGPKAQCPLPNAGSDTDVEDNGVIPDVGATRGSWGAPGDPDVAVTSPNPDVSPPASHGDSSDTDEMLPTPDVRRRIWFRNPPCPDGAPPTPRGHTDVEVTDPKCRKLSPKRRFPQKSLGDPDVERTVSKHHVSAPKTSEEAQNPDVEVPHPGVEVTHPDVEVLHQGVEIPHPDVEVPHQGVEVLHPHVEVPHPGVEVPHPDVEVPHQGVGIPHPGVEVPHQGVEARCHHEVPPPRDQHPPVPPDVRATESSRVAPDLGLDGGARSDGVTPAGDTGVTVTLSDTEEDFDLFLEPTQNFLAPMAEGAAPGWDPEEPTQPFIPPEEEEEEQPPRDPPDTRAGTPVTVTLAQEGTGSGAAPGGEVGEEPRRSQRLARSRGGGASAEGGARRGGAPPGATPVRRSLRLQTRPLPPLNEVSITRGRGQVEPRPPAKPRPRQTGSAPSQGRAQEEEELPEISGPQLRSRGGPGSAPPKVLFTGVVASPAMEVALRTLGGSMATSVCDCTHLVTDRVRRTVKFLCAVARGIPIVTPEWLHKSSSSGRVLAPGPFLVCDSQQERHFGFSLAEALRRARRHPLLQGYEVHVTPSVRPEPEHMRDIITCSGGTFLPTMPDTYGPRRVVISCGADAGRWAPALGARLPVASPELLLTGLLRQRLQLRPFLLHPPGGPPPGDPRHLQGTPGATQRLREGARQGRKR